MNSVNVVSIIIIIIILILLALILMNKVYKNHKQSGGTPLSVYPLALDPSEVDGLDLMQIDNEKLGGEVYEWLIYGETCGMLRVDCDLDAEWPPDTPRIDGNLLHQITCGLFTKKEGVGYPIKIGGMVSEDPTPNEEFDKKLLRSLTCKRSLSFCCNKWFPPYQYVAHVQDRSHRTVLADPEAEFQYLLCVLIGDLKVKWSGGQSRRSQFQTASGNEIIEWMNSKYHTMDGMGDQNANEVEGFYIRENNLLDWVAGEGNETELTFELKQDPSDGLWYLVNKDTSKNIQKWVDYDGFNAWLENCGVGPDDYGSFEFKFRLDDDVVNLYEINRECLVCATNIDIRDFNFFRDDMVFPQYHGGEIIWFEDEDVALEKFERLVYEIEHKLNYGCYSFE